MGVCSSSVRSPELRLPSTIACRRERGRARSPPAFRRRLLKHAEGTSLGPVESWPDEDFDVIAKPRQDPQQLIE
jgi:hypothetical protein